MASRKNLAELAFERARLIERIAAQREALALQFVPVAGALGFGERVSDVLASAVRFVRSHPLATGTLAVGLVFRKPRFSLRWVRRGFMLWRGWRTARGLIGALQLQLERAMAQGPTPPQPPRYRRR